MIFRTIFILTVACSFISAATIKDEKENVKLRTKALFQDGLLDFTFNLFKHLSSQSDLHKEKDAVGKNLMLSPLSLEFALGMALYGAKGETRNQLAKALLNVKTTDVNGDHVMNVVATHFNEILNSLDTSDGSRGSPNFTIANMMYPQEGYDLLVDFVETLKQKFNASVRSLDYQHNPELAVQQINGDIEKATDGIIKNLFEKLDAKTRLVLANAIYFKAEWMSKFKGYKTHKEKFYLRPKAQGEELTSEVDLMFQSHMFKHAAVPELKLQAVVLPYRKSGALMMVILPDEDQPLSNVAHKLTKEDIQLIHNNLEYKTVNLYLPKFKMESTLDLVEPVRSLGASDMFSERKADFSRITSDPAGLYVTKIVQKAALELNEEGTVAAAATGIAMETKMAVFQPEKPIEFRVNRPFMFLLGVNDGKDILFMGQVYKP